MLESPRRGDSNKFSQHIFLGLLNTIFLNASINPFHPLRIRFIQLVAITSFIVISNAGIKRVDCIYMLRDWILWFCLWVSLQKDSSVKLLALWKMWNFKDSLFSYFHFYLKCIECKVYQLDSWYTKVHEAYLLKNIIDILMLIFILNGMQATQKYAFYDFILLLIVKYTKRQ